MKKEFRQFSYTVTWRNKHGEKYFKDTVTSIQIAGRIARVLVIEGKLDVAILVEEFREHRE